MTGTRKRLLAEQLLERLLTPFNLAILACLLLAGWALWSGGALDGPIAREVRASSVYVAPELDIDEAAAEQIIGNRRLVVVLLGPDANLREGCQQVKRAADGTVVLLLSPGDDKWDTYGCALLPDHTGENFGKAFVVESRITQGVSAFPDRPSEALKAIVLNYDLLVKAGLIPDGARTVSPSLPRYLIAAAAVLAVTVGSAVAFVVARRAGRRTASYLDRREATTDQRNRLSAIISVLAEQLIELDQRYPDPSTGNGRRYRELTTEYAEILDTFATAPELDEATLARLARQAESLSARCRRLARAQVGTGS